MASIQQKVIATIIAVFMLLILVSILSALSPDLTAALIDTPNGLVTLALIGLIPLAYAVNILLDIFQPKDQGYPPQQGSF
jgi:hypothetical protein